MRILFLFIALLALAGCGSKSSSTNLGSQTPVVTLYAVNFDWTPPASGSVSRYWVWQTPNYQDWAVASIIPSGTSVTLQGYQPGRQYTVVLASQGAALGFTQPVKFQFDGSQATRTVHLGQAGTPSTTDAVVPGPPSGTYSMIFQWDPPASTAGLTGYRIMQSDDAIHWTVAAEVGPTLLQATLSGFSWNQTYYMGIAAVSANGASEVNVITPMDYASDLSQVNIYLLAPLSPP
jgi:hypothetical protein